MRVRVHVQPVLLQLLLLLSLLHACSGVRNEQETQELHSVLASTDDVRQIQDSSSKQKETGAVETTPEATAIAITLLGSVVFFSGILHLVHSSNASVRKSTWEIVSGSVSIFLSLLVFHVCKTHAKVTDQAMGGFGKQTLEKLGASISSLPVMDTWSDLNDVTHSKGDALTGLMAFFVGFLLLSCFIRLFTSHHRQEAYAIIGAHFVGFLGMDAWGRALAYSKLSRAPHNYCNGTLMAAFMMVILCACTSLIRNKMIKSADRGNPEERERELHWKHRCIHSENEVVGFVVGFLISMAIRFKITGKLPDIHGSPKDKSSQESLTLLIIGWCLLAIQVIVSEGSLYIEKKFSSPMAKRMSAWILEVLSMTTGWVFLYATSWYFWNMKTIMNIEGVREILPGDLLSAGQANKMTAAMVVALIFSLSGTFCIFAFSAIEKLNVLKHRTMHHIMQTLILGVGFSWESAFYTSISSVAHQVSSRTGPCVWVDIGLASLLCAIVFPAWMHYILPYAMEEEHDEHEEGGSDPDGHHASGKRKSLTDTADGFDFFTGGTDDEFPWEEEESKQKPAADESSAPEPQAPGETQAETAPSPPPPPAPVEAASPAPELQAPGQPATTETSQSQPALIPSP